MPQNFTITMVTRAFDDADQYGNITWSCAIDGSSDKVLLKTKPENQPKENDVIFGQLEPSKSGKATWLKKKRRDDYPQGPNSGTIIPESSSQAAPVANGQDRDSRIEDQVIYKGAVEIYKCGTISIDECASRAIQIMDAVKARHDAPQVAPQEVVDDVPF